MHAIDIFIFFPFKISLIIAGIKTGDLKIFRLNYNPIAIKINIIKFLFLYKFETIYRLKRFESNKIG